MRRELGKGLSSPFTVGLIAALMMSPVWSAVASEARHRSGWASNSPTHPEYSCNWWLSDRYVSGLSKAPSPLCSAGALQMTKPLHPDERIERSLALWRRVLFATCHRMPVSPFDGANRIRFKGSPTLPIFNCRLPFVFGTPATRWQLEN